MDKLCSQFLWVLPAGAQWSILPPTVGENGWPLVCQRPIYVTDTLLAALTAVPPLNAHKLHGPIVEQ